MRAPSELGILAALMGEMALKRRADYERALRGLRWGELPVCAVGSAATLPAALTFACAFEEYLEWPVVVREAGRFLASALGTLRTGSVVVLMADGTEEVAEAAREARRRGARVLAVASEQDVLTVEAQEMVVLPAVPAPGSFAAAGLQHAAAGYLVMAALRLLKRPPSWLERVESEWADLPHQIEGAVPRFGDAISSVAAHLSRKSPVFWVGSGLYLPAAQQVAAFARAEGCGLAAGVDPSDLSMSWLPATGAGSAAVFLAGSRQRAASRTAELAGKVRARGAVSLALTDANDHELVREVQGALLLPGVSDLPGSILRLALGGWLAGASLADGGTHRAPDRAAPAQR